MVKTFISVFNADMSSLRGLVRSHLNTVKCSSGKEFTFNENNDDLHDVIVNAVEFFAGKESGKYSGFVVVNISSSLDHETKSIMHTFHIVSDDKNDVEILEYC